MTYHALHLSALDFGDSLRLLVCHDCGRSLSVEANEDGALMWRTLKVVNQGDFYALHRYGTGGIEMTVEVEAR
jgi:hypothetical protein